MTRYLPAHCRVLLLRANIFSALLLIQVLLSGCGTVAVIDKNQSDLMPKSVAMSIFEKYGFKQWAEKPFVSNIGSFCGTEKEFIEFNEINAAIYSSGKGRVGGSSLAFIHIPSKPEPFCYQRVVSFNNVTEAQALELTNAARALGATKIEKLEWSY